MKCSEIEELLSAYANNELPRTQREFIEEHLAVCDHCRAALEGYRTIRQQLTSLRAVPAITDIKESTMSRIESKQNKRAFRGFLRPALAAIPVAAILIALFIIQPWSTFPDTQTVLAESREAASGIQSYRIIFSGTQKSDGDILHIQAEGAYSFPGSFYLKLIMDGRTNEYIRTGEEKYIQDVEKLTGWNVVFDLSHVPDIETTMGTLDQLVDIKKLPDEKIDGIDCFHYRGIYPNPGVEEMIAEVKSKLTEEQIEQMEPQFDEMRTTAEVDIWIGKEDYLIRREQFNRRNLAGSELDSYIIKYYDFNLPVAIAPPLDSGGGLLPGWRIE